MNTTAPKLVIDTNIFIAAISRKSQFRWIFDCLIQGKMILCVSNEILFEYREILAEKTNKEIAENIIEFLSISPFVEKTEIYFNFRLIPDEDDNKFADCAVSSNAACLVSNDKHFQILKNVEFPKIIVLKLSEFEEKYKQALTEC
ncbi:MAG: putative toxin-antitoxin system toxin component, PIN family [Pyrinomonadaceae bacterium]